MYKIPENSHYLKPPVPGAIATKAGWIHPKTNELLVSVLGLPINDNTEPAVEVEVKETLSNKVETTIVEETIVSAEIETVEEPEIPEIPEHENFIFKEVEGGVEVTLAPNIQHKWSKWEVNGEQIAIRGNTVVLKSGDEFVVNSPKGVFSGKV